MTKVEDYAGTWYDNFEELEKEKPSLAKELLDQFDRGKWQENQLLVCESIEDYAYYELTDGWYANKHFNQENYNGAPNPLSFINLKALGLQLTRMWDEGFYYLSKNNLVAENSWGCWD